MKDEIKLIIRGDDLGMTHGSTVAFEKALNQGLMSCASIIVPGPWFERTAELCRNNPDWCIGVHLCLIGEWQGLRWRPVLPWDRVPSLVDQDGCFFQKPSELFARRPELSEIESEFRAQVHLVRKKGINIQYIDTHHMMPADPGYPGITEILEKIGRDFAIPVSGLLSERIVDIYTVPLKQKKEHLIKLIEEMHPALWLWFCHPGIDSPEQHGLIHSTRREIFVKEGIGRHKAEILNLLISKELREVIERKGIVLTNYREL